MESASAFAANFRQYFSMRQRRSTQGLIPACKPGRIPAAYQITFVILYHGRDLFKGVYTARMPMFNGTVIVPAISS